MRTLELSGERCTVTVQAPWVLPYSEEEFFWYFHAAALFLLIPFFFATWLIEYWVTRNKFAIEVVDSHESIDLRPAENLVWKAVRNANILSYGLIAILLVANLAMTETRQS